jgi:HAD superfamily hydrolase (TIGR01509 family)
MIDTILFDFVGVLLFPKENITPSWIVDEIDWQVGQVTNDSVFKEKVLREYHLQENEFEHVLQCIVDKYEPYLPLWEMLPELIKNYKLGIINNGTYLTYPLFEAKYHIPERFDIFLSSAREGFCKPERAIYLRACQALGSRPGNCLFMDDSKENILGAQRIGMQTLLWVDKESGFNEFITRIHHSGKPQTG